MNKPLNQKAWLLVVPVFICVAFSAILPLMTVVNYSVQDIISPTQHVFVGTEWFRNIMTDPDLRGALGRQIIFSACVLLFEIPLGVGLALAMPASGWRASAALVVLAMPLLIPWNVVGTIWQIFGRPDIGLLGYVLNRIGVDYNYTASPTDAWVTVLVMDIWHWTPLVALLCYAGLRAIPDALMVAFSTASSSATLPVAMRVAQDKLGINKPVFMTVLPLGAAFGKDGTAMYVGLLSMFSLQALGVEIAPASYLIVLLTATLAAFGTAPVPSASLFMLAAVLAAVGTGVDQTALVVGFVLPFDRLLDMTRTVASASANLAVATTVARMEGELDEAVYGARDR